MFFFHPHSPHVHTRSFKSDKAGTQSASLSIERPPSTLVSEPVFHKGLIILTAADFTSILLVYALLVKMMISCFLCTGV